MGNRKQPTPVECLQPQDFTVRALISEHVTPGRAYLDFRSLEVKAMRRFGLRAGDRVDVTFHRVSTPPKPPAPCPSDDFGCQISEAGRPPKPAEPQLRIIKESSIPPRTDGHVSWWRRLVTALGYVEGER
jgi:hypothetical protein